MAKRKIIIRLIATLMAGLFITTSIPAHTICLENTVGIAPIVVEAAESFPDLSDSSYCETIAPKKISVYKDSDLNTRGTCSPSKAYNSYIDKNDDLRLIKITSNYIKVSFPTPNGRKTGFIARNELIGDSAPSAVSKANGKGTTYTSPGGKSYGYYENGDRVYKVGNSGAYTAVIYTAKSKNRAYKLAWTRTDDYNRYCQGSGGNTNAGKLSEALYHNSGAYISCGFDGYKNTSGRHEGIDIKYKLSAPIYSLTEGKVLRVASGSTGRSGLSTIAIYNSATDKTVIYLHADPCVKEGQKVSKGDKIGYESWRGISSKSSSHTHVEVRNGKQGYAAKSVNDSNLDNSNPSSFWNSLGYTIK